MKKKKTVGAPSKKTDEIVSLLETGFSYDFNVSECCNYAGISRDTYYTWLKEDQSFSDRMDIAQSSLRRKAKINISSKIKDGDEDISKWYLERRAKDEYSQKQQVEVSAPISETAEKVNAILREQEK